MNSLSCPQTLWPYKHKTDSHQGTNWSKKQKGAKNKTTDQKIQHRSPFPGTKQSTSKSVRVLFQQIETPFLMWKRHLYVAKKPCHNPKVNCARTCTNTVNAVSWKIRLEYFIYLEKKFVSSVAVAQEITGAVSTSIKALSSKVTNAAPKYARH